MKAFRRLAASTAALTIAATAFTGVTLAPVALAESDATAAGTPAETYPGPFSEVEEVEHEITEGSEYWQRAIVEANNDRIVEMTATSPAMDDREISMAVIKAGVEDAPTIYMLNGADGGEGGANWIQQSDILEFYLDKGVNVVIPMEGQFSYYTDWVTEPSQLGGKQMWETFLTKELPGPIEEQLGANDRRAIVGMSMSATSSLLLAQHNQGFYDAVGSFSGCAATVGPIGEISIEVTLDRANATPEDMWGPRGSANWTYNDALINAEQLRGTEIYVSNGSGLAGLWDLPTTSPRLADATELQAAAATFETTTVGGVIEGVTNVCTHDLNTKLKALDIPADFNFRNTGTHSWGYWQEDLWESWPTIARGLGVDA